MDKESQKFLTLNTHMGLFRVLRLPFAVSSAVRIFQRVMTNLLKGLSGVIVYLDDILKTGPNDGNPSANHQGSTEKTVSCWVTGEKGKM